MVKLRLRNSIMLIILLILISMGGILGVIIIPSVKQTLELRERAKETQQYLERQYQNTKQLRRSLRELDRVRELTQQFRLAGIKNGQELALIQELEQLALRHDVGSNLGVEFNGGDKTYTVSFSLSGDLQDLMDYIRELESMSYYVIIDRMQWNTRGIRADNQETAVNVSFRGMVYLIEE